MYKDVAKRILASILILCMIGSTPDLTLLAGTEGGSTGAEHTYAYGSSESATTNNYINAGEWIANAYTVEANTDSTMNVQKLQSVAFALDKSAQNGDSTQHIKSADYRIDIYKYKPTEEAADVLTAGTPAATLTGAYEADKCTDGTTYYSVDLADQGKSVVLGNGECFAVKVTLSNAFSKADDGTAETPATQIHYESSNDNGAVSFANGKRLTNRAVHIKAVTVESTQEIPIEGVQFTQNSLTLVKGEEQQLTVDYTPATTSQRGLKWESDDKSVVTVDDNGKVTAVAAGNANVTVKSAVDDSISDTIGIEVCKDIANLTYSVISDQTYQGVALEPTFEVKDGDTVLDKAAGDYAVTYDKNTNVGQASVKVTANGNGYKGEKIVNFNIVPADLGNGSVTAACASTYPATGSKIELSDPAAELTVTYTNKSGTNINLNYAEDGSADFKIKEYKNNIAAGNQACVVLEGTGNYTGTIECYFQIKASAATVKASVDTPSYTYDGSAQRSDVTVKDGETVLKKGRDYKVTYPSDVTSAGTKTIHIEGIDAYDAYAEDVTYVIHSRRLTNGVKFADLPNQVSPVTKDSLEGLSVTYLGKELTVDQDYTIDVTETTGEVTVTLTGIGNFQGTDSKTVKTGINIANCTITVAKATYTGSALTPEVTVTNASGDVVDESNYTLAWRNNVNAGDAASVTVSGIKDYAGVKTQTFPIDARDINTASLAYTTPVVYQKPADPTEPGIISEPTLTYNGRTLKKGTDYDVTFENNEAVGQAKFTVKGKGNFTGNVEKNYSISTADINDTTYMTYSGVDAEYTYTGTAIEPTVILQQNGVQLEKGTDYSVTYSNNTKIGTAHIYISGEGNYKNSETELTFEITKAKITAAVVDAIDDQEFTGKAIKPAFAVSVDGVALTAGVDFDVDYADNIEAGKATITLTGKNNYTGTKTTSFGILKDISTNTNTVKIAPIEAQEYAGDAVKPDIVVTDTYQDGTTVYTLEASKDYTVDYAANNDIGTATVTVTGKGYYKNSLTANFEIVQGDLGEDNTLVKAVLTNANPNALRFTGSEIRPEIKVTCNGHVLSNPTDYKTNYFYNTDVTNSGSTRVRIYGAGKFAGTRTIYFKIIPKDISYDRAIAVEVPAIDALVLEAKGHPDVTVKDMDRNSSGGKLSAGETAGYLLTEGESKDYTLGDVKVNADGSATVEIIGQNNYAGSLIVPFTVNKTDTGNVTIKSSLPADQKSFTYTGNTIIPKPEVTMSVDGLTTTLEEGTDYTVSSDAVDVGTGYTYTINFTGKYTGTYIGKDTFAVTAKNISDADVTVDDIPNQVYTGLPLKPAVTVRYNGNVVNKSNYTIDYSNNTESGATATVAITGQKNFTGSRTAVFQIRQSFEGEISVTGLENAFVYTSKPIEPQVEVLANGKPLVNGVDYTLSYKNNINANDVSGGKPAYVIVNGAGEYAGEKRFKFTISRKNVLDDDVDIEVEDATFTGGMIQPKVKITYHLPDGSDYVLKNQATAGNNRDYDADIGSSSSVGEQVTVKIIPSGINFYVEDGYFTKTFRILPKDLTGSDQALLSDYTITCPAEVQYDAAITVYEPNVILKDKSRASDGTPQTSGSTFYQLEKGKDYTITYQNNTRPGTATYTIEGKGNYTGTYKGSFTILANLKDATVVIKDQTYTGNPITPSFTVSFGDMTLRNEVDYTYEFSDNTNAGTATLTIIGTGSYAGSRKDQTFKILQKPIGDADVIMSHVYGSYSYTGEDVHPDPHFTYNGKKLALNTDFTCTYQDGCSKAGEWYSFTVEGIGNFTGTLNKEYQIGNNYTDSTVKVTLSDYSFEYTGKPITPMVRVTEINAPYTELKQNIDYQFEYEDNVDAGTAYVNTWGDPKQSKYAGNVSVPFEITPKSISDDDVAVASVADTTYTREAIEPTPVVTWNGKELIAGEDFNYVYKNNKDAGTATVTIEGIGNFTGSKSVDFEIKRKDISGVASDITIADVPDQIYTGKASEPKPEITWNDVALDPRSDYTLTYDNNIELGEATVTIEGIGNYTGTVVKKFNIIKVPVERMEMEYQKVWQYTGNPIEPPVKISYEDTAGNKISLDNSEFTITYKNTIDCGVETGLITITGNGNYEGTKKCFYTIEQRALTDAAVTMDKIPSQVLDADNKAEPKPVIIFRPDSKTTYTLIEGADYEISYTNNTVVGGNGTITIKGLHNFTGTLSQQFYIGKDIKQYIDSIEFVDTPDYIYNGKAHTPAIKVNLKDGVSADLVEGRDYEVLYDGQSKDSITDDTYATKAGLHKVSLSGLDPYGGGIELTYEISKRDINKVKFDIEDQSYTGSEVHPFIMGIDVDANTTLGEDESTAVNTGDISRDGMLVNKNAFTTSYEGNCTDIGTVKVTITATDASNYTGSRELEFKIVPKDLNSDAVLSSTVEKQEYTGKAVTPGVELTDIQRNPDGEVFDPAVDTKYYTLVEGVDYNVEYTDNIYPGVVTMTITGVNHYTGTLAKRFEITADLANAVIAPIPAQMYQNGTPVTPELTVTLGDRTLLLNFDYTVTYSNNTGRGTATATIYPVAGSMYTGSQSATFEISRELSSDTVTVMMIDRSFSYTGSAITPEIGVIYGDNQRLTAGVDYTVSYENNVNVGTATARITGTGVFTGTVLVNFTIIKRSIIRCNFGNILEQLYNGSATDQTPLVTDGGRTLTAGTDYTVAYVNNTQPGIATMTITGKGNYGGIKTIRYLINVKDMTEITASAASSKVKLSWDPVDGAGGYAIYTADNKLIAKTTATSYTHKKLKSMKTYTYKVRPYVVSDGACYYGGFSNTISIMTKPAKVSKVKLKAGNGQATIKWKKIKGVSGYAIYRSTKKSGRYKKIKTVKKASTTSYTNKNLSSNKKYYYKVRAYKKVKGKKVYGSYSSVKSVRTK